MIDKKKSRILASFKALVGPLVFKKDGQPSCGFGSDVRTVVIIEADEYRKLESACLELETTAEQLKGRPILAPVQGFPRRIPWDMHLQAWESYARKYGTDQSPQRIAERGGFGTTELDAFIPGWRQELDAFSALEEWERWSELGVLEYIPEFARALFTATVEKTTALLDHRLGPKARRRR